MGDQQVEDFERCIGVQSGVKKKVQRAANADKFYIGTEIKNFDLFWDLLDAHDALIEQGCTIEYILVPREENQEADDLANLGCDEAEQHYADGYSHDYPILTTVHTLQL